MTWTDHTPTVPGWYWIDIGPDWPAQMTHVGYHKDWPGALVYDTPLRPNIERRPVADPAAYIRGWCGPLEAPCRESPAGFTSTSIEPPT